MSKVIYLDPIGGISGDMFSAAFLDAGLVTLKELQAAVDSVITDVKLIQEKVLLCGISATRFKVILDEHEQESLDTHCHIDAEGKNVGSKSYSDIQNLITDSDLIKSVKALALAIFETLAKAEAKVHGKKVSQVIFHEVGANDAIADIICAAVCINKLAGAKIICGPLPLGQGTITFSHGTIPVPAPATLEILKGVPVTAGFAVGEMTTPTGAAIAVTCSHSFEALGGIIPELIGYGCGARQIKGYPNCLRVVIGEQVPAITVDLDSDEIVELTANIDDQPAHILAPALDSLLQAGALEVFFMPYVGKKGRQGQVWTVLAKPQDSHRLASLMMKELGTIGVRMNKRQRLKLYRQETSLEIDGEKIRAKRVYGCGIDRTYPEPDELIRIAQKQGISLREVIDKLK